MGFLDSLNNIKGAVQDRLQGGAGRDDYYDDYNDEYDDYNDEYPEDDGYAPESSRVSSRSSRMQDERANNGVGLLGNPARPAADSVNVFTRSGSRVDPNSYEANASSDSYAPAGAYRAADGAYRAADESWRSQTDNPRDFEPAVAVPSAESTSSFVPPITQPGVFGATGNTPGDRGLTATPRTMSGKLPAYVLKPTSYDDVQTVVRRVRTNQPVVLNFKNLKIETAKRILDFSFGLACGVDGSVEELGDRVFVVLPQGVQLSDTDKRKLRQDGVVR